jgi:hypothetical protein
MLLTNETERGIVAGTKDCQACGILPVVHVVGKRPEFKNNGYNCYNGQKPLEIVNLVLECREQFKEFGMQHGHLVLRYDDGDCLMYASNSRMADEQIYDFH